MNFANNLCHIPTGDFVFNINKLVGVTLDHSNIVFKLDDGITSVINYPDAGRARIAFDMMNRNLGLTV